jgi:hypothetical protein
MRIEKRMSEGYLAIHFVPHAAAKEIYLHSMIYKYYNSISRNFLQEEIY